MTPTPATPTKRPIFSTRHYIEIAALFHESLKGADRHGIPNMLRTIVKFSAKFKKDNPNFSELKFKSNCLGINSKSTFIDPALAAEVLPSFWEDLTP